MFNFGAESNNKVCSCGKHHGCGDWTPERRAASMKFMSYRMPSLMNDDQRAYLATWEKAHGIVLWRWEVVKHEKNKDIMGAVFIDASQEIMDLKEAQYRADIHG